jgi:hypothetical protein
LPGVERYYVKLDRAFDADAWYASFKAGHVFVTNGPMLEFSVNGHAMGDELHVRKGEKLTITASAALNPDIDRLGRLDLIVEGEVAATRRAAGARVELREELTADRSMWVAVRATGERELPAQGPVQELGAVAHTAPIYVIVDDHPFWKAAALKDLVQTERQILQDLLTAPVDPMGDLEAWETVPVLAPQWERQRLLLRPRVRQVEEKYADMLRRAETSNSAAGVHMEHLAWIGVAALVLSTAARRRVQR